MKSLEHIIREIASKTHEYQGERKYSLEHEIRNVHEAKVKVNPKAFKGVETLVKDVEHGLETLLHNPSTKGKELVPVKPKTSAPEVLPAEPKSKGEVVVNPEVKAPSETQTQTQTQPKTKAQTPTPVDVAEPPKGVEPKDVTGLGVPKVNGKPVMPKPDVETKTAPKADTEPKAAPKAEVPPKGPVNEPPPKGPRRIIPFPFVGGGILNIPPFYDNGDKRVPNRPHLSVARAHKRYGKIKEETRSDIENVARSGQDRKTLEYVGKKDKKALTRQGEYKQKIIDENRKLVKIVKNVNKEARANIESGKTKVFPNVIINPEIKNADLNLDGVTR